MMKDTATEAPTGLAKPLGADHIPERVRHNPLLGRDVGM